jgi:hypothetical protein
MTDGEIIAAYNKLMDKRYAESRARLYNRNKKIAQDLMAQPPVTIEGQVHYWSHFNEVDSRTSQLSEFDRLLNEYPMGAIVRVTLEVIGFDESGWGVYPREVRDRVEEFNLDKELDSLGDEY